jgi:glycosyltransferase involved in cell wall biosynthesis
VHLAYLHYLTADDMACHHARQFAEAARGLGHRVDVHAMNQAADPGAGPARPGVLKRRLRRWLHEPRALLMNAPYLHAELARLRAARPDVLLVRDHFFTATCVPLARRLGLPLVVEVNAPAAESRLYLDQYAHLPAVPERLQAWKLRRADAVTAVSTPLKRHLVATCGLAAERVSVCPNGADATRFHPDLAPDPALAGAGPLVGFIGSFQPWHGTALLAAMIRRVAAARPAARFALVGDGPERAALVDGLADLGARLIVTGTMPHARMPAVVAALDVGVLPAADFYRCPLKLVEWMAAGRALVAPRHAPIAELVDDGAHGVLVAPDDAAALSAAVVALLDAPERRAALGAAAAARVQATLTWTHNAERVLAVCERARRRHQPAAAAAREAHVC